MPRVSWVGHRLSRKELSTVVISEHAVENKNELGRVVLVLERTRAGLQTHPVAAPRTSFILGYRYPEKSGKHRFSNFHRPPVALINRIPTPAVLNRQSKENHFIAHTRGHHFQSFPLSE